MIPQHASETLELILARAFEESNSERKRAISTIKHRPESSAYQRQKLRAFEADLDRRACVIKENLRKILETGWLGDAESTGEVICHEFLRLFAAQATELFATSSGLEEVFLSKLRRTSDLISAALNAELRLIARQYVMEMRPVPSVNLLPEQETLLTIIVESWMSLDPASRSTFLYSRTHSEPLGKLSHRNLDDIQAQSHDLDELSDKGLIRKKELGHVSQVTLRPEGFRYYEKIRAQQGAALERVEQFTRSYITTARFRQRYPVAFERWSSGEALLWDSDVDTNLTMIGLALREAIQAFATSLVDRFSPSEVDEDPQHDQARVKATLDLKKDILGRTTVKALKAQYSTVSDLVQRLVHGAQREREALTQTDARRAVFLVASAMMEVDGALGSAPSDLE